MNLSRILSAGLLLVLASHVGAAEERDRVLIRHPGHAPGISASTMPLLGWSPGTFAGMPVVMGRLFPPTLIMQRQRELNLSDQQQEAIKAELREFQSRVVDVQWDLESSQGELESVLGEDRIDPDAAGTAIDRVMAAENALKKLHLHLLIRIRNVLEPEQIEQLSGAFRHPRAWMMPLSPDAPPAPAP